MPDNATSDLGALVETWVGESISMGVEDKHSGSVFLQDPYERKYISKIAREICNLHVPGYIAD